MENKRLVIMDPALIDKIHKIFPTGVKYAEDVMDLALKLSEVSETLYRGSLFSDYGIYPFLNVDEAHYENGNICSKQIIIESEFDRVSFDEFLTSLSISESDFEDIMKDVDGAYKREEGTLDTCYLSVMRYLIAYLKCIVQRREERKAYMETVFSLDVDYSCMVKINSMITLPYVRRKLREYNRKHAASSGKWFRIMSQTPVRLIVSCVKYQPKWKV